MDSTTSTNSKPIRKPKIEFSDFVIEVTRKCNMKCPHCLRGDAQCIDITQDIINSALRQVKSIGCITFTGGEPTLNIPAIRYTLQVCKHLNIPVYAFYIVTNGKKVTNEFLHTLIDWYNYCISCNGDETMCGVAVSRDSFHTPINPQNLQKLSAFSFFRPTEHVRSMERPYYLLDIGRAKNLKDDYKRNFIEPSEITTEYNGHYITVPDDSITVTAKGEILARCDYEYDNIHNIYICPVTTMSETFYRMATDCTYNWKHPNTQHEVPT